MDAVGPTPARFGAAGATVFTGTLSASLGQLGYSSGGGSATSISIEPAFDYFSSEDFSEGASLFARYSSSTSGIGITNRVVSFGASAHLGANLWLGQRVSLWPRLELGLWQSRSKPSGSPGDYVSVDGLPASLGQEVTENVFYAELFAPFLFHLAPHFFVGIGPDGYLDLLHSAGTASNKRRFLGVSSTVGGWF